MPDENKIARFLKCDLLGAKVKFQRPVSNKKTHVSGIDLK